MVIVQLIGGLGNQFFQYAAGRAIAYRHNVPLKLDLTKFEKYPLRKYVLNNFNIFASIAEPSEVAHLIGLDRNRAHRRLWDIIQRYLPYYRRSVFFEQHFHYDPNIAKTPSQVCLVGYWQSEKYFKEIAPIIREELTVKSVPDPVNQAMACLIDQTESVSLHIRRGDYVSNPNTARFHGGCTLEYYYSAVQKVTQTVKQPHFFVFSDDIAWAEQNMRLAHPVTYVGHNGEEKDYEDLRLMSRCKHHILANSTFSWWGAWLCENAEKVVIAPQKWFGDPSVNADDLIPQGWLKL